MTGNTYCQYLSKQILFEISSPDLLKVFLTLEKFEHIHIQLLRYCVSQVTFDTKSKLRNLICISS